jgi:hypothetical protein
LANILRNIAAVDSLPGSSVQALCTKKVLVIHNAYGARSGEEMVVDGVMDLLRQRGPTLVFGLAGPVSCGLANERSKRQQWQIDVDIGAGHVV